MDNASIHKGEIVKQTLKELGYFALYPPPYSPWFNPIEGCFSIVKKNYSHRQNIEESFNLDVKKHFKPFFDHSLRCEGLNTVDSIENRQAANSIVDNVENEINEDKPKKPAKKIQVP